MAHGRHTIITNWVFYRSRSREKTELVMMVCLPSCNIDCPIYIWRIESQLWKFYKRYPHLSTHLQIRPCLVHPYLPQPHCWAIKKGSLWNNLAWWPLPALSIPMPPPIPTTSHHLAPLLLALSLIFHFFDDISRILSENWYLKNVIEKMKDER